MPKYAHLPLILKADGKGKLSKRDKSGLPMFPLNWTDVRTGESYVGYRESGYFPDAFVNMLALLGWNSGTNQEIFSMEELINAFSFERVSKSGARFDPEKTKWFNQQYLRKKSDSELAEVFAKDLAQKGIKTDQAYLERVCGLVKEKAHFVAEFWDLGHFFFVEPDKFDEEVVKKRWNENSPKFFNALIDAYRNASDLSAAEAERIFKETSEKTGTPSGQVMQLFRVMLSGAGGGPVLFEMVSLLGKDKVVERLERFVKSKS
jgi:glutamyl-tRNA synthetase